MNNIIELLKEKKEFFTEYKQVLTTMLDCPPEQMPDYSNELDTLKEKINIIDNEIKNQCKLMGQTGEEILLDIKNKTKREELNEERKLIYDLSQSIYNIIASMNSLIEQIKLRAKQNMNETMEKIKSLTDTGKGVKYLKAVDSSFATGTFLNLKK